MVYTETQEPLLLEKYLQEEAHFDVAVENSKNGRISYIDNTSDEIYDALVELLDRMENNLHFDTKAQDIQKYYQSLTSKKYLDWEATTAHFSTKFLLAQA